MATHTLSCINGTSQEGCFVIFQTAPETSAHAFPLAWQIARTRPSEQATFRWNTDYSFVWAPEGTLMPGIIIRTGGTRDADLTNMNAITLARSGRSPMFEDRRRSGIQGTLTIHTDSSVRMGMYGVGIGIGGSVSCITPAIPACDWVYMPSQEYRVAFGNFYESEVLDMQNLPNTARVEFPPGGGSMIAVLGANGAWKVESGS